MKCAIPILLLCLAGCTSFVPVKRTELYGLEKDTETRVNFDPRLLQDCDDLPLLTDVTDDAVVQSYAVVTQKYAECRAGKQVLADEIRSILDIKADGSVVVKGKSTVEEPGAGTVTAVKNGPVENK